MLTPMRIFVLLAAALTLAACSGGDDDGGPYVLPNTETFSLTARDIGQTYDIRVALPRSYGTEAEQESYPLIVLLDADYSFAIARNVVDHLSLPRRGQLPEAIVVAIGYPGADGNEPLYQTTRTRDYTPIHHTVGHYSDETAALSGGAPAFLRFIGDTLLPELEERYPIDAQDRTLSGHSFGGLFTSWALLTRPDMFARWVIVSPSLWYADEFIFDYEQSFALTHARLDEVVFLGVGSRERNDDWDMVGLQARFAAQLDSQNYASLSLDTYVFADDTHASVWPAAFSRGLRSVFNEPLPGAEPARAQEPATDAPAADVEPEVPVE